MKAAARRQAAGALKLIRCGGIKRGGQAGREAGRQGGRLAALYTGWIWPQNTCKLTAAPSTHPVAWPGVAGWLGVHSERGRWWCDRGRRGVFNL